MSAIAVWIAVAATILGAFLSALHMSLREMSRGKLQMILERKASAHAANGNGRHTPDDDGAGAPAAPSPRAARVIQEILDDIPGHSLALSLPRIVCNLAVVVALLVAFTGLGEGSEVTWVRLLAAGGLSAIILYIIGVAVPASVSEHIGEELIHRCAGFIRLMNFVMTPIVHMAGFIDVLVKRMAGAREENEEEQIERELLEVVTEGETEGSLGELERRMIEAVVHLRSATAQEIMTPRTEIEGFELTDDLEFIKAYIEKAGHSRIPVYKGDLDHIVGVLYAKDLIRLAGKGASDFKLRPILRKPEFAPETKPLLELLTDFQARKVHMAIVIDEYGGTAGLVTIEDLLEEIVGEIRDEFEPVSEAPPRISVIPDQRAVEVDARAYIHDVNDMLEDLGYELPEGEDYDTVGGFVLSALGHMPVRGEEFAHNGFVVRVLEAEPTRVTRVRVEFREGATPAAQRAEASQAED